MRLEPVNRENEFLFLAISKVEKREKVKQKIAGCRFLHDACALNTETKIN